MPWRRLSGRLNSAFTVKPRGFTLIETLVALVIAATAAAVILSHVRTLMLRAEKEHAHQFAVLQVLNDALRLSQGGLPPAPVTRQEKDALLIEAADPAQPDMPPVRVWNFSAKDEPIPPIAFAYTPFQLFGVSRDRYTFYAIGPALKPPGSAQNTAALPGAPAVAAP